MSQLPLEINTATLHKGKLILRALNHPLRLAIIQMIHQRGSMTVTQVYTEFKLDQPVASQHLAILRKAGIVITERRQRFMYYSVNYKRINEVHEASRQLVRPAAVELPAKHTAS